MVPGAINIAAAGLESPPTSERTEFKEKSASASAGGKWLKLI
jgi:hypothetical protein